MCVLKFTTNYRNLPEFPWMVQRDAISYLARNIAGKADGDPWRQYVTLIPIFIWNFFKFIKIYFNFEHIFL